VARREFLPDGRLARVGVVQRPQRGQHPPVDGSASDSRGRSARTFFAIRSRRWRRGAGRRGRPVARRRRSLAGRAAAQVRLGLARSVQSRRGPPPGSRLRRRWRSTPKTLPIGPELARRHRALAGDEPTSAYREPLSRPGRGRWNPPAPHGGPQPWRRRSSSAWSAWAAANGAAERPTPPEHEARRARALFGQEEAEEASATRLRRQGFGSRPRGGQRVADGLLASTPPAQAGRLPGGAQELFDVKAVPYYEEFRPARRPTNARASRPSAPPRLRTCSPNLRAETGEVEQALAD